MRHLQKIYALISIRTRILVVFLVLLILLPFLTSSSRNTEKSRQQVEAAAAPTPTTPPGTANTLEIYGLSIVGDQLQSGWTAKTWNGGGNTIYIYDATHVYSGTHAISFQPTGSFDSMELIAPAPFDISQYKYLSFFAWTQQPQALYQVMLAGQLNAQGNHTPIGTQLPLAQYGGIPNSQFWTTYDFPVANLLQGAGTTQVYGIIIQEINGGGNWLPLYVDDIDFSTLRGVDIAPPGQATPIGSPPPPPTPVPPYYPNISPWVFIIPGIIIFLAVIFE